MPSSAAKKAKAAPTTETAGNDGGTDPTVVAVLDRLSAVGARDLPLVDLMSLAEHIVSSVKHDMCAIDDTVMGEVRAIAESISRAKQEIGRLQPAELSEHRIPQAGRELAAIVEATEDATHTIMEAAEGMLAAEAEDPAGYKAFVEGEAMKIFEACTFQDITGQRVSKVVETLQDIEERIDHMASTLGIQDADGALTERESERDERKKRLILNGPALEGEGIEQDAIDALLDGPSDDDATQASIDALFD